MFQSIVIDFDSIPYNRGAVEKLINVYEWKTVCYYTEPIDYN